MPQNRYFHRTLVLCVATALTGTVVHRDIDQAWAAAPTATDLYGAAQKLFDAGKYADALLLFRQAYDASKSPNARLMVGTCFIALGRLAEAHVEMTATLEEATEKAKTDSKYVRTRDEAAKQLELIDPKVGKIIVNLPSDVDARVTLNGGPLAADRLGKVVAVEPGSSVVVATREDGSTARSVEKIGAGETKTVDIVFEAPKDPKEDTKIVPVPTTTAAPKPPEPPPKGGALRTAGFVTAGVGVVGMILFAATGAKAKSEYDRIHNECGGNRCTDPKYNAQIDSGVALQTAANVGLGIGLAGLLGGGIMIAVGGPQKPKSSTTSGMTSWDGVSISYAGTF